MTIEPKFSLDQARQINHLAPDGVLAKDTRAEAVRNVAGGEHHGPFVGLVALGRHADCSSSEILHLLQP